MAGHVTLPFWLAALLVLLAVWAVLERLLIPSVRWILRRRVNLFIEEISKRLHLEIHPFALTKRQVLIDRLMYDPKVLEAAATRARENNLPRDVVMAEVERYAREIVPSFNAYVYFRIGYWLARKTARILYRVRVGFTDEAGLSRISPKSSVVFVMNHRSNMDYILVAYLAATRTALSYAVGEWARIWPLQTLIRALGAYFIRRNSGNPLYRLALERYVNMATESGVVQAVYPEGGLTRDGALRRPKLGLLDYMVRSFNPDGERNLVFIPVGINYDRTLEDRSLLVELDSRVRRKSIPFVVGTALRFFLHNLYMMLRGRWYRFGYACVNFGSPVSMREYCKARGIDFRAMDKEERFRKVEALAEELMVEVGKVIPVGIESRGPPADQRPCCRGSPRLYPPPGPGIRRRRGAAHADAASPGPRGGGALPGEAGGAPAPAILRQLDCAPAPGVELLGLQDLSRLRTGTHLAFRQM